MHQMVESNGFRNVKFFRDNPSSYLPTSGRKQVGDDVFDRKKTIQSHWEIVRKTNLSKTEDSRTYCLTSREVQV